MTVRTVVIVDDDPDMRLLVRLVLERTGDFRVVADVVDGPSALTQIDLLHPPPVPDIVVLDNRMPDMSGLEVAERVRVTHPRLPIILFSAFLDDEVRAQAQALGIDACLAKGDYDELPQLINELIEGASAI